MLRPFLLGLVLVLALVACTSASTLAPESLRCTVAAAGHGIDTRQFTVACTLVGPAHDTMYTITGTLIGGDMPMSPFYRLCQGSLTTAGPTYCQSQFVVIVPSTATALRATATFLPSRAQVPATIPLPSA